MAYTSSYSGSQIDGVISLFYNKGLGSVVGTVKRNSDGTFEVAPSGEGSVTSVGSGEGLTGGPITSTGTLKANLKSFTKLTNDSSAATEVAGRIYPIVLDASGYLAVNVPWTNENSSYVTKATLTTAGDMFYASSAGNPTRLAGNSESSAKYLSMSNSTPSWKSFSGGSFTSGSFSGGSFTQGTDSFIAASLSSGFYTAGVKGSPTTLDLTKFSGGSFSSGTFSAGTLPSLSYDATTKTLTFSQGTLPSHASDSFTSASLDSGFYTQGSATTPASIDTSKFNGGSFTQGEDSFTPASHGSDSFTAATFS